MLPRAWPVNGEGEGREVGVLVEAMSELAERLESIAWPPTV